MSRFHKIQQRTNVFTMLILVAGLYIAFRYTSFKHGVGWSLTGKPAGTTSWQPASAAHWAMPEPMSPQPTMPTRWMSTGASLGWSSPIVGAFGGAGEGDLG